MLNGVKINKLNGGLGRRNPATDNVIALVCAVALANLPAGKTHYAPIELLQAADATTAGFNAAFDANTHSLVNYSVNEIFRLAPDAVVYLIAVPTAATPQAVFESDAFKTALRGVPEVKGLGIIGTGAPVTELAAQVEAIQLQINALATESRLLDFVILEGAGEAGAPLTIATFPDLRAKNAPNVSVCIAQDPAIAALDAAYAKHADVAAVLGMLAIRSVNENAGSVNIANKPAQKRGDRDYPLTEAGRWAGAALSSGADANALSNTDAKALTAKGYIFATSYQGYGGVFLNSSPTCVEAASDYAYIENNRVWNKAARAIRAAMIPELKGVVKKDPDTGYIRSTTITRWQNLAQAALDELQKADEISGSTVYIDPKQILSETSPLAIRAQVVSDDIVHEMVIDLGLAAKI